MRKGSALTSPERPGITAGHDAQHDDRTTATVRLDDERAAAKRRAWARAVLAGDVRTFDEWAAEPAVQTDGGADGGADAGSEAGSEAGAEDDRPLPSDAALELVRRVTAALAPTEPGTLRDRLRADVVADVLRLAADGTGTAHGMGTTHASGAADEVDAELVGELLAGVFVRTLALVDEARAEVARG
ncbi:hypothetical protein [Cellulomonas uda]|uniref:hypothetical protein n=1 Tax=Cellulomonas uda TaxID=1714 RepID=UPI001141A547|nr:hypothetical protein [Cellulomonas uda]NII65274.1 hypothetical protein [Cellulomonas uda]